MPHPDAERWNERYVEDGDVWLQRSPRDLLLDFVHLLPARGLALDAAAGVIIHGRFLAARGLHVIALDISEEGLRRGMQVAREKGLRVEAAVYDLAHPWLPADTFDLIVNFRFLQRATFPVYRQALKPGGLLIFETFVKHDPDLARPHHYLEPGELRDAFADFEIIHSTQTTIRKKENLDLKTSQLIARKPLETKEKIQ